MNSHRFVGRESGLAIALCILTVSCQPPERRGMRVTEPRLSGYDEWQQCIRVLPFDHVVERAQCGPPNPSSEFVSLTVSECDDAMSTADDAVRLVAETPRCTDAAVEKLEMLAKPENDARLLSDLAGAYYIRAQR